MCRSRFDIFMNSGQQINVNKRARGRAVSRIPTTVLKRVMETLTTFRVGKTETNHEVQLHIKAQSHPSNNTNELAHGAVELCVK